VTLSELEYEYTAHILTNELGGSRFRFQISEAKESVAVGRNKNIITVQ
jgi:hypothetical protein